MIPKRLKPGDTIGLISPSAIADPAFYAALTASLEGMGYRVKPGNNLYSRSWGYAASDQERADDIHQLAADEAVSARAR